MRYRLREILFSFRKVARKEEKKGNLKKVVVAFFLSIAFVVCYYHALYCGSVDQLLLQKSFYALRGKIDPPDELVLVSIDDETYKKLKLSDKKPFPRQVFAEALAKIQHDKPRLVILDFMVSPSEGEEYATKMLAEAIGMGPTTVARNVVSDKSEQGYRVVNQNQEIISNAASMEISMTVQRNDTLGDLPIVTNIATINKITQDSKLDLILPVRKFINSDIRMPHYSDKINFYGPKNTIRNEPLWRLFSADQPIAEGFFKDKVIVVGHKSEIRERAGIGKEIMNIPYPVQDEMYGAEIQANILGNLLDQKWIRALPLEIETCLLLILSNVLFFMLLTMSPLRGLCVGLLYLAAWFLISYIAFVKFLYFIPGFYMLLLFSPFIFGGASCATATLALRELRETKKMLGLK